MEFIPSEDADEVEEPSLSRDGSFGSNGAPSHRLSQTSIPQGLPVLKEGAIEEGAWEEDMEHCGVCRNTFGALLRRHHCRICGRCVCATCSPSSVVLPNQTNNGFGANTQRACTPCVGNMHKAPALKKRLAQLSGRVFDLGGGQAPPQVEPKDLDQATSLCENALMHHEEAYESMRIQVERAEAEIVMEQQSRQELASQVFFARDFICQLGEKLHAIHGRPPPSGPDGAPGSFTVMGLEEAMHFCEQALGPLKEVVAQKQASRSPMMSAIGGRSHSVPSRGQWTSGGSIRSESNDPLKVSGITPRSGSIPPRGKSEAESECTPSHGDRDRSPYHREHHGESVWEEDTPNCSICRARLGKRFFKFRHHCRMCGKCVCASCSPSCILVEGERQLRRTCTPCASGVQKVPILQRRVSHLAERLVLISGTSEEVHVSEDLEQAFLQCEAAVQSLQDQTFSSKQSVDFRPLPEAHPQAAG